MYIMPKKKEAESEDQLYERFLKKLLKDPRFKQLKPVVIKALSARGMGGGRGGGRGGRTSGLIQTPNQDNFIKIHSAILDTNAKLSELSNQMKRGQFETDKNIYWLYQQGYQGNSQASPNIPPPKQGQLSMNEYTRQYSRESVDLDNLSEKSFRRLENDNSGFYDMTEAEAEQGHIPSIPNIPPPKQAAEIETQTEARMYDTADMLSVMSHASIAARLKAHGIDTKSLPVGVDALRESTAQLYKDEFKKQLHGVQGAIDLNLLQSGQRGRPRLQDPIIEPVEEGEED